MATTKPRITITLNHRQYEVLKAISDCSNQPMSAFISELLDESLPVLERMAESFRKIKAAQDEQKKRIADELEQAQAGVEPILEQVLGQFDLFMTRVETAAGAGGEGMRKRPPRLLRPPTGPLLLTGGHTHPNENPQSPSWQGFQASRSRKVFQKSRGRKP